MGIVRVYFSSPIIHDPDAKDILVEYKEYAKQYLGVNLLTGLDHTLTDKELLGQTSPEARARVLFAARKAVMDKCQAVIADIAPFLGPGVATDTAWEIGYAHGTKKPIVCYTEVTMPLVQRMKGALGCLSGPDAHYSNFGLIEAMTVICSTDRNVLATFQKAVKYARHVWFTQEPRDNVVGKINKGEG